MQIISFEDKIKLFPYILFWFVYALLHIFSMWFIIDIPVWALFVDGFFHALLFAFLGIVLWSIVQYGISSPLSTIQKIVNYSTAAFLTVFIWLGAGFLLNLVFSGEENVLRTAPTLPLRSLVGILLYFILILVFKRNKDDTSEKGKVLHEETQHRDEECFTEDAKTELLERISVKEGQKLHIIATQEIVYLQADGDYVQIVTEKGKYLKEQTMKFFELNLPPEQFVRIHRSYIVNIEHISRIEQCGKQNQLITLKNGSQLKASPSGYKNLKITLNL